jgi:hypothetical protein
MDIFEEWLKGKKRLTPAEVRAKNVGDSVWIHQCYGKQGEHLFVKAEIVQTWSKKQLSYRDYKGDRVFKDIKSNPKIAYTED